MSCRLSGLGISKLNPLLQITELNFQIIRFSISQKSIFRGLFQAIAVAILTLSTFSFSEGLAGQAWEHYNKMILFLPPIQTHAQYRLVSSDFKQNRDCVDVFIRKSLRLTFKRLGALSCTQTDMTSLIAAFFATCLKLLTAYDITLRYNHYSYEPEINPQPDEVVRWWWWLFTLE